MNWLTNVNIDWLRTLGFLLLCSLTVSASFLFAAILETELAGKMKREFYRVRKRIAILVMKYYYKEENQK